MTEQDTVDMDPDDFTDDPGTRRCDICGFWRSRSYFARVRLPQGGRITMCRQCAATQAMYRRIRKQEAARA